MVQSTSVCLSQHGPTAANLLFAVVGQWAGDNTRLLHCQYSAAAAVCGGLCHILSIHEAEYRHTHTHTRLMALFPGLPVWAGTRKVKPIWILLKQGLVAVASAGPYASLHLAPGRLPCQHPTAQFFYRPDALPAAQPTASKHWRHKHWRLNTDLYIICVVCSLLESKREADRCGQSKWNLCSVRSEAAGEAFCNSCQQSVLWRQLACVW